MAARSDLEFLRRYQREFAESIDDVALDAPVRGCGDWTARELVEHLTGVYAWATRRAGGPRPLLPSGEDLAARYRAAATILEQTLVALDPDEPCWTLLDDEVSLEVPRVGTRRFWHRRQKLETLVHLWDLRTAGGLETTTTESEWLDCLDEVVTVMQPRQRRLGRTADPTVRLVFEPERGAVREFAGAADGAPRVIVRGSAQQLALLVWGRTELDDLAVDGEPEDVATALAGAVP